MTKSVYEILHGPREPITKPLHPSPSFLLPSRSGKLITWAEFNRREKARPLTTWQRVVRFLRRWR